MTDFEYKPYHKVTIKELVRHDLEDFKKFYIEAGTGFLRWCNGIIFSFNTIIESEFATNSRMRGEVYWGYVAFAKMENFEEIITKKKGHGEMGVADVSNDPLFVDFVKWLRTQPIWSDKK